MFKNKNVEFWFWLVLAFINIFVMTVSTNNKDDFTFILGGCMLALCSAKALVCAMEIESSK